MKILIVDDNKDFTYILKEYLTFMGFEICGVAADGMEAISMIEQLQPNIAILDIMVPKVDGIEVLRRYNPLNKKTKCRFIVLTAVNNIAIAQKALNLGADLYIVKPFDMDRLVAEIRRLQHAILLDNPLV